MLGFNRVAQHRSKDVHLWRRGGINLIVNYEPNSPAYYQADEHGPSACALAFRVRDSHHAYNRAVEFGAQPIDFPLNEDAGGTGQIEEFLMQYNGEGIQHIAFACDKLFATWDRLQQRGLAFMEPPPDTYYEMLEDRLPGHGERQRAGVL